MLYEMKKKEDLKYIIRYGKAGGALLLSFLLPDICDIEYFYVFDSMEEFEKIKKMKLETIQKQLKRAILMELFFV